MTTAEQPLPTPPAIPETRAALAIYDSLAIALATARALRTQGHVIRRDLPYKGEELLLENNLLIFNTTDQQTYDAARSAREDKGYVDSLTLHVRKDTGRITEAAIRTVLPAEIPDENPSAYPRLPYRGDVQVDRLTFGRPPQGKSRVRRPTAIDTYRLPVLTAQAELVHSYENPARGSKPTTPLHLYSWTVDAWAHGDRFNESPDLFEIPPTAQDMTHLTLNREQTMNEAATATIYRVNQAIAETVTNLAATAVYYAQRSLFSTQ